MNVHLMAAALLLALLIDRYFGEPPVRLSVQSPQAQDALSAALQTTVNKGQV
ncbi:hypothetical protein [Rhodoferax ferrireducens]|uniref:hypothetical protein n=1 Tax=Rhodoferax ferrireducens TaxID=192843 RepID=UPI003BB7ADE4